MLRSKIANFKPFAIAEIHEKIKILAKKIKNFLEQDEDICTLHNFNMHLKELKFKFQSSVIPLGSLIYGNSFEVALLFKSLADQFDIASTLAVDDSQGCKAWNEVCDGNNVVDLFFDVGEIYHVKSFEGKNYVRNIL